MGNRATESRINAKEGYRKATRERRLNAFIKGKDKGKDRERLQKRRIAEHEQPLWSMSKPTAWRMVKRVMARANIHGPQATGKGLRHGFSIACVLKNRPLHKIRDWLGHTNTETPEIYTAVIGAEGREMLMGVWEDDG